MKVSLIAMAAALVTAGAPTLVSADNLFANDDKATPAAKTKFSVVDVRYRNKHDLQSIADNYDILGVDEKGKTASVLVDAVHKAELEDEYTVTVDEKSTAELQASVDQVTTAAAAAAETADAAAVDGVYGTIPGYLCYRTVEGTYATAADLAANYPNLAEWNDIGDSWEKANNLGGYDIFALNITNKNTNPVGGKPVLFANCAIHAREYATAELCTRFAEMLVQGYDVDADITALLDHHQIHLILQTNPDGRKQAEAGDLWRKNTNQNYCGTTSSSRGADLNRNFPFKWGGNGASTNQCSDTFRGASAESEPETQAVMNYLRSLFPVNQRGANPSDSDPSPDDAMGVALDIHSYSELVLYPWGDTSTPPGNGDQFVTLGRKLAFYNGYNPQPGIDLYATTGTTSDSYYALFGVAGITYELGTAFFQDCLTFENTIVPDNLPSLLYAAKVARTPFKTPAGPDALNLSFGAFSTVNEGDSIVLTATIDDTRYETQNGVESSQNIASASMYIDTAPWEAGATPIAMSASDGAFNANVESVTGTIDTTATSMTPGRHIVYVVGTDANGNEGAYSATFLEVIVPVGACSTTGSTCTADSDCCNVRRRLQACAANGQECSQRTGCCSADATCVSQGGGLKICEAPGTEPPTRSPTASPSLRPSTSNVPSSSPIRNPSSIPSTSVAPTVCECVFPTITSSPTSSPPAPTPAPPTPTTCSPKGNACIAGDEGLCCSGTCSFKGPNYKCD